MGCYDTHMRRLTLILSDLYLPEESTAGGLPATVDLPSLDELLRFASEHLRVTDWRRWLARDVGLQAFEDLPVAQACALDVLNASDAGGAWLAVPVHLEARLDHVRLADRGLLRLDGLERDTLRAEFDAAFGPQYRLHDIGERGFLLSGLANTSIATVDPARLLDADIGPALPGGAAAAEWRRLGAEIEMWLHAAPLNAIRERNHQRRISALWLWGGGAGRSAGMSERATAAPARQVQFHGADPFLAAVARRLGKATFTTPSHGAVPGSFHELGTQGADVVVELAPLTGATRNALHTLETNWFAPVRAALTTRALSEFVFVANDRCLVTPAGSEWKFWRRRTPWLTQLAASR
jgi:hypothetical protein